MPIRLDVNCTGVPLYVNRTRITTMMNRNNRSLALDSVQGSHSGFRGWLSSLFVLVLFLIAVPSQASAQEVLPEDTTTRHVVLPDLNVRARRIPRKLSREEREAYWRRIRDVKKTLPYAKYVAATIIETYEYMETLPEKEQKAHLKRVERELRAEMEPKMRKLTLGQGKILIKLIKRQCGSSSYELVKSFLGSWKAFWWNAFARFLGANLKDDYAPATVEDDAVTERIVQLVEAGVL